MPHCRRAILPGLRIDPSMRDPMARHPQAPDPGVSIDDTMTLDPSDRPYATGGHDRGYSRFVQLMKLALISAAVMVLGVVLAWPQIGPQVESLTDWTSLDPREADPRSLVNPRYMGVDDDNQPYELVAREAIEQRGNPDVVDLDQPQGDIVTNEGRWVSLRGNTGVYRKVEETLALRGDVVLYRDDGVEFYTEEADLDLNARNGEGHVPVWGRWSDGTIRSDDGFTLLDGGRVIHFKGRSYLLLYEGGGGIAP